MFRVDRGPAGKYRARLPRSADAEALLLNHDPANWQVQTQEDRKMKRIAVLYLAIGLLAFGAGQAFAHPTHATPTKVTVVMHDPGCHWFSVNGAFKTKLAVKGSAKLFNVDEAALKVVGAGAARRVGVGKTLLLAKGTYVITMVGQAPDDNHLKLVVR
jgi:hypothetical protein